MDPSCIFCRIVAGEIPAVTILETDEALAFLDINPIEKGHVLVIPKIHFPTLLETPDATACHTMVVVRRIAAALMATGAEGVNVLQSNFACAGQEVPHLHFHVIPRTSVSNPRSWASGAGRYASSEERDQFASRLRDAAAPLLPPPSV